MKLFHLLNHLDWIKIVELNVILSLHLLTLKAKGVQVLIHSVVLNRCNNLKQKMLLKNFKRIELRLI